MLDALALAAEMEKLGLTPRFNLLQVGATAAVAHDAIASAAILPALARHLGGEWGDLDDEDKAANEETLRSGEGRLHSSYTLSPGRSLWIITDDIVEGPTTILFPEDY